MSRKSDFADRPRLLRMAVVQLLVEREILRSIQVATTPCTNFQTLAVLATLAGWALGAGPSPSGTKPPGTSPVGQTQQRNETEWIFEPPSTEGNRCRPSYGPGGQCCNEIAPSWAAIRSAS